MTINMIDPSKISEVLLRAELDWLQVKEITPQVWKIADGTKNDRGKRGWKIVLIDGTEVFCGAESIEGVR